MRYRISFDKHADEFAIGRLNKFGKLSGLGKKELEIANKDEGLKVVLKTISQFMDASLPPKKWEKVRFEFET